MPAIVVHESFGCDAYEKLSDLIGVGRDERQAFLIGNQGPDVFYYLALSPTHHGQFKLGRLLHHSDPNEMLVSLKESYQDFEPLTRSVARAYALGFLGHYVLDSSVHPWVYWLQNQLCTAGVKGLDERDRSIVHTYIERELDEMALYLKWGKTVKDYRTWREILHVSQRVQKAIAQLYQAMIKDLFDLDCPPQAFLASMKHFRRVQWSFYSPTGMKQRIAGWIEKPFRRHSYYRAISLQALERTESLYDNHEHWPWVDPFTGELSCDSFCDRYEQALDRFAQAIGRFDDPSFDRDQARLITEDRDFCGVMTVGAPPIERS